MADSWLYKHASEWVYSGLFTQYTPSVLPNPTLCHVRGYARLPIIRLLSYITTFADVLRNPQLSQCILLDSVYFIVMVEY